MTHPSSAPEGFPPPAWESDGETNSDPTTNRPASSGGPAPVGPHYGPAARYPNGQPTTPAQHPPASQPTPAAHAAPPTPPTQQTPAQSAPPRHRSARRAAPPSQFADREPADLGANALLETIGNRAERRPRPEKGWRRSLYDMTGGRWNPGLSKEEREEQRLMDLIRSPLPPGVMNIMVWSQKGGVGKTTLWTILGIASASARTDKVLGLDVNPDGGSASVRVPRTTDRTILDLRDALRQRPLTPVEFDQYVNHAAHRYDSIVMPPGKKPAQPLSSADYDMLVAGLESRYPYKLVFTDCGTNLSDPVMDSVFAHAHQMVVVTTTVKDEATVTAGGLEALIREGREDLVRNAITVLVEKAPRDPDVEVQRVIDSTAATIRDYFAQLTKTVVPIPYDSRIRIGDVFDPAAVSQESKIAHLRLAANVVQSLTGQPPVG